METTNPTRSTKNIYFKDIYFQWLISKIEPPDWKGDYYDLLLELDFLKFTYILPMDKNRMNDGISLRNRFSYEVPPMSMIDIPYYSPRPVETCTVLEMMVALSLKMEDIMYDEHYGERPWRWFWNMIRSLGLLGMKDEYFNEQYVCQTIILLLTREYSPDGRGGLFTIPNSSTDLNKVEIWYQMQWYLDYITGEPKNMIGVN